MDASSSKKRSRSAVNQVPQGDTQNAEAAAGKERETKKKSYDKKKAENEQTAADLKKLKIKYAHLEGKFDQSEKEKQKFIDQSEKEKQKFIDLADRLLEERREFNKLYEGNENKITELKEKFYALLEKYPQIFGSSMMERGSTSAAGTEVVQGNGPSPSLPADSGTIYLAYNMLKERYAASEARLVQEITALVELHAQEVAAIRMEHQQELENLRQEAWVGEQNLSQDQNLNFNPDDLLNDN